MYFLYGDGILKGSTNQQTTIMNQRTFMNLILWRVLQGFDFDPDFILFLAPETGDYNDVKLEDAHSFFDRQITLPEIIEPMLLSDKTYLKRLRLLGLSI